VAKRIFNLVERIALLASQQGGYASRQDIAGHVGTASQQAWNALIPAKSQRAVGPGLNRSLDGRLTPFLRELVYLPSVGSGPLAIDIDGRFSLPEPGYVSFYQVEGADSVEEVPGMGWGQRLRDPNCGPTTRAYIVRDVEHGPIGHGHQIAPIPEKMVLNFYAQPTEPVYFESYVNDVATYDDTRSVDTGWGTEMDPELMVRALRLMGVEIRDPALQAVAAQLTAESV